MKIKIDAALKRYNANSNDKYVGDCVPRSLCLAFGEDYNDVRRDLNRIVRNKFPWAKFNYSSVFEEYLKQRNIRFNNYPDEGTTEDEFCDQHPEGTYLLLTGDDKHAAKGSSTHMVCVIDGDIYDSWDSSEYKVIRWATVSGDTTEFQDVTYEDVIEDVMDYLINYVEKLDKKFNYGTIQMSTSYKDAVDDYQKRSGHVDKYTFEFVVFIKLNEDIPHESDYHFYRGRSLGHTLHLKINPKWDVEKNIEVQQKKLKQRIYDWVYNIRKDLQDADKSESVAINPNFRGYRKDLMRLPEWVRPYVLAFDTSGFYGWPYELYFEALPGDPNPESITLRTDTMADLKYALKCYQEDYTRIEY